MLALPRGDQATGGIVDATIIAAPAVSENGVVTTYKARLGWAALLFTAIQNGKDAQGLGNHFESHRAQRALRARSVAPCSVLFARWVTPVDAATDLFRMDLRAGWLN